MITDDVGRFQTAERFDRIISVEMFEHVRNHEELLSRIATWLIPEGRLFVHIFVTEIWPTRSSAAVTRIGWAATFLRRCHAR